MAKNQWKAEFEAEFACAENFGSSAWADHMRYLESQNSTFLHEVTAMKATAGKIGASA